ncbi:MAG: DNA-3-methyladenine glycosylase 1 [Thermoanaerobaculia bacterium]|nr:DNA-3-methyladenine glycosylase 1 [Thermoanaerobaculia bacterium]
MPPTPARFSPQMPAAEPCFWSRSDPVLGAYHDTEWGFPVRDDVRLFEKLCLEGFQAGLSWLTILKRREGFRAAFAGFDFRTVAQFGTEDVERLVLEPAIIRHRGKIVSVLNNAARAIELSREFGSLAAYFWSFEPPASARPARMTEEAVRQMTTCEEARRLSKDLKRRGWTFVGPTTVYAFMQAMGLVNDHVETCPVREPARAARAVMGLPPG